MRGFYLAIAALALACPAPASAADPNEQPAGPLVLNLVQGERTLWVYEGGSFQKVGERKWIEFDSSGNRKFEFKEVERTDHYVELHDTQRKLIARFYFDHQKYKGEGENGWREGYKGHWAK
jgi:hypothetical protein